MSWQQPDGQSQPQQPEWGSAQPQTPQPAQFGAPQQPQLGAPQPGQAVPPPFYTPHPYEKKRSGFGARQIISIVVLLVIVGGYFAYKHLSGSVSATSLSVGECFNGGSIGDQDLSTVHSLSCTSAHSAQVIGTFTMTDSTYPDDSALSDEATTGCKPFNDKVDTTGLPSDAQFAFIFPEEDSFNSGNKTVECLVQSDTEDLTTSVLN
ncbi:MAG TPA: hypothetical protein VGX23_03970 [Actinocrinis sp.]|nr:hypothetical protein [Actinocrinis sp.]